MNTLANLLVQANIPFQVIIQPFFGTPQILVPSLENREGGVICNEMSYGGKEGLLETYGFNQEDVCGYLTVQQAFDIIKEWWEK